MRINNMLRSHRSGADGVVVYDETLRHERPPRPLISERNLFLEVAATPPLGGGECLQPLFVAYSFIQFFGSTLIDLNSRSRTSPGFARLGLVTCLRLV